MANDDEPESTDDLTKDLLRINDAVNDALYKANRRRMHGHEHLREDALEEIEAVRDLAADVLERERQSDQRGDETDG